jgi:LysR family transcriptional regulator for metE and metH
MAIECHSCFEWLLPAIDAYRNEWSDVELDISSGFHFAPFQALARVDLDLVITADPLDKPRINYYLIFCYEAQLAVAKMHPLVEEPGAEPRDLADEVVITYSVDRERLALFSGFLEPAGVEPARVRHAELTTVIVQLVASGRGVTCLPNWALHEYLQNHYVVVRSLGEEGVWPTLYAAARKD